MIEYKDIGWWYWLVTVGLLSYGLSGNPDGYMLGIALTIINLTHFIIREKSITAFPVQVRYWYLLLIIVVFPEPLRLLYWLPIIGTWAQVIFGYCAMARIVSLLPWNNAEPISAALLKKTFLSRPVRGNIQHGFSAAEKC